MSVKITDECVRGVFWGDVVMGLCSVNKLCKVW